MSVESITYALLSGAGAVTSVAGTRVYPQFIPQGTAMPAVCYEVISVNRINKINAVGASHLTRSRVQVNVISPDMTQALALRSAVIEALEHQRGPIGGSVVHSILHGGESASYDEQLSLFTRSVDFLITFED